MERVYIEQVGLKKEKRMAEITDTWYLREHLPSIHSDNEASLKPKLQKISMQARAVGEKLQWPD